MTRQTNEAPALWTAAVHKAIEQHLHQIPYGNLRAELTHWDEADGNVANLAIVYEVPGGSTNQINITFFESSGTFMYLGLDSHEERCTTSLDEVIRMVVEAVARIPTIRHSRLIEDIDRWASQGLSQRDLFQKMNKLLQIDDLRGGTITMHEMKHGITHILAHHRAVNC
jgi:hypothetical protein